MCIRTDLGHGASRRPQRLCISAEKAHLLRYALVDEIKSYVPKRSLSHSHNLDVRNSHDSHEKRHEFRCQKRISGHTLYEGKREDFEG